MKVLKVKVLDVGSKPFTPKDKLGVREFPFNCMALSQGWSLCQECVTEPVLPILIWDFFSHPFDVKVAQ